MKKTFLLIMLILTSCYEHVPPGIVADMAAGRYLDTLYGHKNIEDETGLRGITSKEYHDPKKLKEFQQDTDGFQFSKDEWSSFTKKVDSILSKRNVSNREFITVEQFKIGRARHTTAFFVDSTFRKVSIIYDITN